MGIPYSHLAAHSIDGRMFEFDGAAFKPLVIGQHVEITAHGKEYLGLTLSQRMSTKEPHTVWSMAFGTLTADTSNVAIRTLYGTGVLLRKLEGDDPLPTTDQDTFTDAGISPAAADSVAQYLQSTIKDQSALEIGAAWKLGGSVRVPLPVDRFKRRTFLCGQSGSGKTFALGVILEGLLLSSDLRIVILDPNSDFIRLHTARSQTDVNETRSAPLTDEEYEALSTSLEAIRHQIRVFRPRDHATHGAQPLGIRLSDLDLDTQASLLRLDPIDESSEYGTFLNLIQLLSGSGPYTLRTFMAGAQGFQGTRLLALLSRLQNLRLTEWGIWHDGDQPSLVDRLSGDYRCLVVDLGPLESDQRHTVALAVLTHLWKNRYSRQPVLLAIDEAQHLCKPNPSSWLEAETTDLINLIAAEGRKFGIYLLLATQRPRKVHPNALSECDNAILMRLNSRADLSFIADNFSQVPQGLLDLCPFLDQGEALLVGNTLDQITLAKFEGRVTEEGSSKPA